jgi:peroxiredoxin
MKKIIASLFVVVVLTTLFATRTASYQVGDRVTDFKLKNVDGKMVGLSDYKSQSGLIVIFDCNTCPFSQMYNDRIIGLHKKYAGKGFPVVAINANSPEVSSGDSFEEMVSLAKRKNYEFPYLVDETQKVAQAFGATNTPHVYILQKEGDGFKVAYIGAIDNNARDASQADKKYVEDAIDALVSGKTVTTSKTKAVGCTIKWKNT